MVVVLGTWYEVPGGRRSKMYNVKLTKLIDKILLYIKLNNKGGIINGKNK